MKIKNIISYITISIIITSVIACNSSSKESKQVDKQKIMVYAAASLTDVLSEIIDSFEVKMNVEIQTNFASSGTLARQISQGGEADVYISASKKWANYVDSSGYILQDLKDEIAQNELVLISPLSSSISVPNIDISLGFVDLLNGERLSIGDPAHVPAGKYAQQALEYFGWYNDLQDKLLPAKDVRSALMVVELEEAPLGIVYKTDAQKSQKVKILAVFPEQSHKPIVYIAGVCSENELSKAFYEFLNSKEMTPVWTKYGFKK